MGIAQHMKPVSYFVCGLSAMVLTGCSVNPSVLGGNIAGIAGSQSATSSSISENESLAGPVQAPAATGSIVPLNEEGAVVDLPVAGDRAEIQANDVESQQGVEIERPLSAEERHRQELVNRGDLQEGQPLPVE